MNLKDFKYWSRKVADWGVAYREKLRDKPVRSQVQPGEIFDRLPATPPEQAEDMETIFADFERDIVPGITHWQHPRFFAYFPANAAPPSVIADYLTSSMAVNCLIWQASPAGTEMETRVIDWLRQSIGLPEGFSGVIQDSASGATLVAVLTMRERALAWAGNKQGLSGQGRLRVYCSDQVHTSIDRAIWIAGVGDDNLVRIPTHGPNRAMQAEALREAIKADIAAGYTPIGIIGCVGGTSVGGTDNVAELVAIRDEFDLYLHVDAAWAGSAMICPEYRRYWTGIDGVDSIVFNPHKWLGAQFDCSAHFMRDPEPTVKTLAAKPEYLKTPKKDRAHEAVINYSEWTVPLGRRFRALKIWFLLRSYGLEGLRTMIRNHVTWAEELAVEIGKMQDFEIVTQPMLSLFSFRRVPKGVDDLDQHNLDLVNRINDDGRTYLTQTRIDGKIVIRFQAGQFDCTREDVLSVVEILRDLSG